MEVFGGEAVTASEGELSRPGGVSPSPASDDNPVRQIAKKSRRVGSGFDAASFHRGIFSSHRVLSILRAPLLSARSFSGSCFGPSAGFAFLAGLTRFDGEA